MKKYINTTRIVLFMVGLIASLSLAAMHENGTFNPDQFYDAGTVYNHQSQFYNISTDTVEYRLTENRTVVTADEASVQYILEPKDYCWNYAVCNIKWMNRDSILWDVVLSDSNGQITGTAQWTLHPGENILPLGQAEFKSLTIYMHQQKDASYTISGLSFRDKLSSFSAGSFLLWTGIFFVLYAAVVLLICRWLQKKQLHWDFYRGIDILQTVFIRIGNYGLACRLSEKKRQNIRTLLFFLQFLLLLSGTNMEYYSRARGYHYITAAAAVILLCITFLCIEKPLKKQNWKTPLVTAAVSFWILAMISDFIVDKFYNYTGWLMLFVFGFFYFVLQNMEQPYQIIDEFSKTIQYSFVLNLLSSMICRPQNPGERYCGMYKNPNVYAFYLVIVLIFFLLELDKGQNKAERKTMVWYEIGVLLVFQQIWLAQSLTGMCMVFAVLCIWLLRRRMMRRRGAVSVVISAGSAAKQAGIFLAGIACMAVFSWGINHIPQMFGTQLLYPEDVYQMQFPRRSFLMDIQAAEKNIITGSRLYQKIFQSFSLDSLTTGRADLYLRFIQNMNLWGHYYKLDIAGSKWSAHNELIGTAYRYGVFAVVPYAAMLWYAGKKAVQGFFGSYQKNPYVFCILAVITVGILKLMTDKFEQPFRSMGWMAFYLLLGFLFCRKEPEWRGKDEIEIRN